MNWIPVLGRFELDGDDVHFKGEPTPWTDEQGRQREGNAMGLAMNAATFKGGSITARVKFDAAIANSACELVFYWDPARDVRLSAGIGPPNMFCIRSWDSGKVNIISSSGDRRNLEASKSYSLRVTVHGARVRLFVDDVEVLAALLPFPISPSQTGVFCFDRGDIHLSQFKLETRKGRVFVVMQLTSPFREIYEDVIKSICEEGYEIRNAEETYGPGLIMADVTRDIDESEFVVADITPANPNVYYEVGYADARGRPVILVADRAQLPRLPFDIAANRVLFYENTIAGKTKFEELFRRTITSLEEKRALRTMPRGLTQS
jgi:hypothetical protein